MPLGALLDQGSGSYLAVLVAPPTAVGGVANTQHIFFDDDPANAFSLNWPWYNSQHGDIFNFAGPNVKITDVANDVGIPSDATISNVRVGISVSAFGEWVGAHLGTTYAASIAQDAAGTGRIDSSYGGYPDFSSGVLNCPVNPFTSDPWTLADVLSCYYGTTIDIVDVSPDNNQSMAVVGLWIEISYTATVPEPTTYNEEISISITPAFDLAGSGFDYIDNITVAATAVFNPAVSGTPSDTFVGPDVDLSVPGPNPTSGGGSGGGDNGGGSGLTSASTNWWGLEGFELKPRNEETS